MTFYYHPINTCLYLIFFLEQHSFILSVGFCMQVTSTQYTAHFESWLKGQSFRQLGISILAFELRARDLLLSLQHPVLQSLSWGH